ncbi:RIKEN cDNA 4930556L07, isoform CRA_a, partial [Mus musculus]
GGVLHACTYFSVPVLGSSLFLALPEVPPTDAFKIAHSIWIFPALTSEFRGGFPQTRTNAVRGMDLECLLVIHTIRCLPRDINRAGSHLRKEGLFCLCFLGKEWR